MKSKLKKCKICLKESYIWKKGLCKTCHFKISQPKTAPIKPKKNHLNKYSQRQIQRQKIYQKLRLEYLALHPICEVCNALPATEIHHKAKRYGKNLFRYFLAVDRVCHIKIENDPVWAKKQGYTLSHIKNID